MLRTWQFIALGACCVVLLSGWLGGGLLSIAFAEPGSDAARFDFRVAQFAGARANEPGDAAPAKGSEAATSATPAGQATRAASPEQTPRVSTAQQLPAPFQSYVDRLPLELKRLQSAADRVAGNGVGLPQVRADAERLQGEIQSAIGEIRPLIPPLEEQLLGLGTVPADGAPPEGQIIRTERAVLNAQISALQSAAKRLRLSEIRTSQLLGRLQAARHNLLARDLLTRSLSPLSPEVWQHVGARAAPAFYQFATVLGNWLHQLGEKSLIVALALMLACAAYLVVANFSVQFQQQRIAAASSSDPNDRLGFLRRTWLAAVLAPAFAAPMLTFMLILGGAVWAFELSNRVIEPILVASFKAVLIFIVVKALARAVLLPRRRNLRLVGVDDYGARRLFQIVCAMAAVSGLDLFLVRTIDALFLSQPFAVVAGTITNLIFAVLLVMLVTTRILDNESTAGGRLVARWFTRLYIPVLLAAVAIVVASLLGYLTLGRFLSSQIMIVGCGGLAAFLLHRSLDSLDPDASPSETASGGLAGTNRLSQSGSVFLSPGADRGNQDVDLLAWTRMGRLSQLFGNIAIFASATLALLFSWGFSVSDISSWLRTLIVGFPVGGVQVSPAQIVIALLLFLGLLLVTRLLQRWLSATVLDRSRMEAGLANSIHTGVGYAGTAIALLAGVSYAGLNITNIAIVAGALSVGIGFGLQSIVNNFVSGLILLVERPIKVGDWIVAGDHQGYVRRISVRATEIETFDRASVILPNSELITGAVQNWTHRNAIGRVLVAIGTSYDAEPDQVIKILSQAASKCDGLLKYPAPSVTFENFGDNALEFMVRAYVADVNNSLSAKTELRVAMTKALKQASIEIPFPQRDIHLRDLDGVKGMLSRAAAQRASDAGARSNNPGQATGDAAMDTPMKEAATAAAEKLEAVIPNFINRVRGS